MATFQIGGATKRSKFAPVTVEVDFTTLPQASQDFLVAYGIKQYLADGVAGAESDQDFNEGVAARLAKMKDGTVGVRGSGEGKGPTDSVEVLARQLARQAINAALKAQGIDKPEAEAMNAAITQLLASDNGAAFRTEAATQIEARKAKTASLSGVLAGLFAPAA